MAEKEPVIVVKKITVNKAGHHGGSWKVAFADFMTALMAFFLVMWLISQTDDVKKNVADHFSTPSVIEYHFSNYGVELTLEKLFLDLINEPLKFFQAFVTPVDYTPNIMRMGSKRVQLYHIADQLRDVAKDVTANDQEVSFNIPDEVLFETGTAKPSAQFVEIMEKVNAITAGLEDGRVFVDSEVNRASVGAKAKADWVAEERLDLVAAKIDAGFEHPSADIVGKHHVTSEPISKAGTGHIRITIKNKADLNDRKPREIKEVFGKGDDSMSVYDNFVKQLSDRKTR